MTFSEKMITCQFSLASGEFEGGGNSANIEGLRVEAQIHVTGAPSFATMEAAIYGMPLSLMQQLATVGSQWTARYKNGIDLLAGDDDGMSIVFSGTIFNAYIDAAQMPDTCFRVVAAPYVFESVNSAPPTSVNGSADVADMIKNLATQIGAKGFENAGVSVKLAHPYYYGSPWGQIVDIARDANINIAVDRGIIVITPRAVSRAGSAPIVAPETGMVAYPAFVENRLVVRTLFNPEIAVFGNIVVQSSIQAACGTWKVLQADYDLQSVAPNGNWFETLTCVLPGSQ